MSEAMDDGPEVYVRLTDAERRITEAALRLCASNIEGRIALMQVSTSATHQSSTNLLRNDLREVRRVLAKVSE